MFHGTRPGFSAQPSLHLSRERLSLIVLVADLLKFICIILCVLVTMAVSGEMYYLGGLSNEMEGLSQQVKTWRTVWEEVRPMERLEKKEAGTGRLPEA